MGFFVFASEAQAAATYYVDDNTCPSTGSGTIESPYCKIQSAADIVNPGDTVIVKDGTYAGIIPCSIAGQYCGVRITRSGNAGAWITFRSENKWGAVIDGTLEITQQSGIAVEDNVHHIRIEDFEIKEFGYDGISLYSGTNNVYIKGNNIHHQGSVCNTYNERGHDGIKDSATTTHVTVDSNIIHDNGRLRSDQGCNYVAAGKPSYYGAQHDHGAYLEGSYITIINNIFYNQRSGWDISFTNNLSLNITNVNVINNTFDSQGPDRGTGWKGQIVFSTAFVRDFNIHNNIFSNPPYDMAIHYSGTGTYDSNINISNNLTTAGSMLKSPAPSSVTLSTNYTGYDPLFNTGAHVYTLRANSPAIGAGTATNAPAVDITGKARVGNPDIGAYEYTGSVASSPDVNGSGSVNIKDIQACVRVITQSDLTYQNQCKALAAPTESTNIKDIQKIVQAIIGG